MKRIDDVYDRGCRVVNYMYTSPYLHEREYYILHETRLFSEWTVFFGVFGVWHKQFAFMVVKR